jgi:hypothetical protein
MPHATPTSRATASPLWRVDREAPLPARVGRSVSTTALIYALHQAALGVWASASSKRIEMVVAWNYSWMGESGSLHAYANGETRQEYPCLFK